MSQQKPPILTILIPTRNRAKFLNNTLRRINRSIEYSGIKYDEVEIIVSDNFSKDKTKKIVEDWKKKSFNLEYYKQKYKANSAEESLANSIELCRGEYIWICCDDDFVKKEAIDIIIKSINLKKYEFILFNFDRFSKRKIYNNFEFYGDIIEYQNGIDLFRDFGFITLTSLMPCLCFKNGTLDVNFFKKCIKESPIYSHSFSFLKSYYNKSCAIINRNILTYNVPDQTGYIRNIGKVSMSNFINLSWSTGLIKLINLTSEEIAISVHEIGVFTELQPIMETENIKYTILWSFILRACCAELLNIYNWNLLKVTQNKKSILDFHDICINFFKKITIIDEYTIKNFLEFLIASERYFKYKDNKFYKKKDYIKSYLSTIHDLSVNYENMFFSSQNSIEIKDRVSIATNNNPTKLLSTNKFIFFDKHRHLNTNHSPSLSIVIPDNCGNLYLLKFLKHLFNYDAKVFDNIEVICCVRKGNKRGLFIFNYFQNKIKKLTLFEVDDSKINSKFEYLFKLNYLGNYVWIMTKNLYPKLHHLSFVISCAKNTNYPLIIFPSNEVGHGKGAVNQKNIRLASNKISLSNASYSDINEISKYVEKKGIIECSRESIYLIKKELILSFENVNYNFPPRYVIIFLLLDSLKGKVIKTYNIRASFEICKDEDFELNNFNSIYMNRLSESIKYLIKKIPESKRKQQIEDISFDIKHFILWKICLFCLISIKDV